MFKAINEGTKWRVFLVISLLTLRIYLFNQTLIYVHVFVYI